MVTKEDIKKRDMQQLAHYRKQLAKNPRLTYLFVELTDQCNLSCLHCGSNCSAKNKTYIDTELLVKTLETVAEDFEASTVMICLTGGEPMLHPDFLEIVGHINRLGFPWGMTTNGTLIDEKMARKLKDLNLGSITLSLDGLKDTHNWFRNAKNDHYQKVFDVVKLLHKQDISVQLTTVIHKKNMHELEELYQELIRYEVDSWRVINIEPMGRALEHEELLLNKEEILSLLEFIREKRFHPQAEKPEVCYGCSHYLSMKYEREVRDYYFICGSGIYVASILCNGDIYSCLDIERRAELVQGNMENDRFSNVWFEKFQTFRQDRTLQCEICIQCDESEFCVGDSTHTWDFDVQCPKFCLKNMILMTKK